MNFTRIWLEFEEWGEPIDPKDANSDVAVELEDKTVWGATFFTYANLLNLAQKNRRTGECLGGRFFWAAGMFFVDELTRERVTEVVKCLLATGEFDQVFKQ